MNALNRHRIARCDRALRRYDTDFELTGCLVDFLTDARHWCDRHGHNFAALDRKARDYYRDELRAASKEQS